jgi:hypothetical protein
MQVNVIGIAMCLKNVYKISGVKLSNFLKKFFLQVYL